MTTAALSKQYDPSDVEPRHLRGWLDAGYFHADAASPKVPFAITLPPPNVTGSLHMGHALGSTLQDILIRWRRMGSWNAMWMPGTDHASIAVHVLLEKDLKNREQKSRHDLGRDKFLERAWVWKERSGNRIVEQEKVMGFSLDWERDRFTMDEVSNKAVREAFVRLYDEGLIYRAKRMINWDPASQTVVSDLEVDRAEEKGHLWELRYPVVGSDAVIVVATTRPETMLGDTGVAVHPDDERYRHLVGQEVELPLTGRRIPIVADTFVDPAFGSGAVKVTPAHDFNDYECSQRCGLPAIQVIDADGKMCAPAPAAYVGLTVEQCRTQIVADLEAAGFLGLVKDHAVPRGRSQRSGAVVEPMLMEQWFVKTEPLAAPAIAAVESGKTKFVPELWTKTYMHWMTNIKDWCISRQLWWGHRIPAWYCGACAHITVSRTDATTCGGCGGADLRQDDDILDTWFSSGLWPFSTLGWPDKSRDLTTFYPNSVLVTGPDIIFFWVARMMMMGLHFMGKVPFRTVYLTSIVTDENGDKMSKTKGNVIDPLDVIHGATIEQLIERTENDVPDPKNRDAAQKNIRKNFAKGVPPMGADALRFTLAALNTSGRYIRLSVDRVEGYRNFINKLWNASRFALMNLDGHDADGFESQLAGKQQLSLTLADRWILSRLQRVATEVEAALESFRFSDAANALYQFVWHELCDWYIELAKPHLRLPHDGSPPSPQRKVAQGVLALVLERTLRMLHPIIPFVTEEIWQKLPKPAHLPASLMITVYPRCEDPLVDAEAEREMALVQELAVGVRMLRSTYNVPPSWSVPVEVRIADDATRAIVDRYRALIENSARVTMNLQASGGPVPGSAKELVRDIAEIVMPLAGLIDVAAEQARIAKDIGKADKEIAALEKKLANPQFLERAPEEVVAEQRGRLAEEQHRKHRLEDALAQLG
ncbi:MAG: valine--tRNA ligase [Myxococcales bacterium]|nr:valine--tRNA ligase [Myxococcales bacterium]MBK7197892.1 valine--tRNA ligase [Myxococcales bacterium]MBP6846488.1 valine--tRNA ligase [Kofleriaceae bacterium]